MGAAVIPIENTLAGTVAEHADLMLTREVFIQAEYLLRIVHNVIAVPGVRLGFVAAGVVASGGARPVPRFFPAASENRSGAVL